jgi:glutathione synthase/RimK-type ligase-like ATP-grasp enzyme
VILLWGLPEDTPLRRVAEELEQLGAEQVLLDQRHAGSQRIELVCAERIEGTLFDGERDLELNSIDGAYIRPWSSAQLADSDAHGTHALHALDDALLTWADLASARVVNRPAAMHLNGTKPAQLTLIRECGLDVPDTLVTTDPDVAEAFAVRHEQVIYKSISGQRSIVRRLPRDEWPRLRDARNCPIQLQEHIPGQDVRVHVVGERVLATAVRAEADDYRYTRGERATLREVELEDRLAALCVGMCREMGLLFAGVDLRFDPASGRTVCFEVNPSPGFSYYEQETGQPIARAAAELLLG